MIFNYIKLAKLKAEEEEAWKKLKAYFPDKYVALELEMQRFASTNEKILYHAYVDLEVRNFLGDVFESPMEAVNNLIQKVEEEGAL
jgi:hypothetical protein